MGREVVTERDVQLATSVAMSGASGTATPVNVPSADDYTDRLIKYIPTEVIAVYLVVAGLIGGASADVPKETLLWIVFLFLTVLTPIYLWRMQNVSKVLQLVIAAVSFVVWVFTIGGPFIFQSWYNPLYGAIILPLYTFAVAMFKAES